MGSNRVVVKFLPFQVRLAVDTSGRNRHHERNLLSSFLPKRETPVRETFQSPLEHRDLNADSLTLKDSLEDYFNAFFKNAYDPENSSTLYSPFSHVVFNSIDGNRRLQLDGMFDYDSEMERLDMDPITSRMEEITGLRTKDSQSFLRRRTETITLTSSYQGVAVFTRDGGLPIPEANNVQAKQLQAFSDEDQDFLASLIVNPPQEARFGDVKSVYMSVITTDTPPVGPGPDVNLETIPGNPKSNLDIIIIVAIIVAACSMLLLSFALYLAFQRRQQGRHLPMKDGQDFRMHHHQANGGAILSPSKRTESDNSPSSGRLTASPPVLEMTVNPENDDVSAYTESVFSVPHNNNTSKKPRFPIRNTQLTSADVAQANKVSNRFNPRYIISSKKSQSSCASDDIDGIGNSGVVQELEGVPPMPHQHSFNTESNSSPKRSPSGLYPADVIDDDITSSLSAYGKGLAKILNNGREERGDDGASLSSMESYEFSLEGYSTVAGNSTKYGY